MSGLARRGGDQSCALQDAACHMGESRSAPSAENFPAARYEQAEEYDSFITHRNKRRDLEKVLQIGRDAYGESRRKRNKY